MLVQRYWHAVVIAAAAVGVYTVVLARGNPPALVGLLASLTLLIAAVLLGRDPEQRGNALLLELSVLLTLPSELDSLVGDIGLQVAFLSRWWPLVVFALFFLRYPDTALRARWQRWLLVALVAFAVGGWALNALLWDPARAGSAEPNDWLTLGDWEPLRIQIQLVTAWGLTLSLLVGAGILIRRWRAATGLDRVAVRWVALVGAVLAIDTAGTIWLEWVAAHYWDLGEHDYGTIRLGALGVATAALLVEAVRRRAASVGIVSALLQLSDDRSALLGVLRRAFADPALTMRGAPDGPTGAPLPRGRVELPIASSDGTVLGFVETDASALRDPGWTRTVLTASGVALENAQLHRRLVDSLAEVRLSRTRIVEASLAERRRVERDLHDGAQQHLLAAASSLGRLELVADKGEVARGAALADAKAQLGTALVELRRLARGIYPPVLTQAGLAAALRTLPDTTSVPIHLDLDGIRAQRFDPAVESTAWFVACECVTNAVRHAAPDRITIAVQTTPHTLELTITDDGAGGAAVCPRGLAGLTDRLHALGGDIDVRSTPGAGTLIRACIPAA